MGLISAHLDADLTAEDTVLEAIDAEAVTVGWTSTAFTVVGGLSGYVWTSPDTLGFQVIGWKNATNHYTRFAMCESGGYDVGANTVTDFAQTPLLSGAQPFDANGTTQDVIDFDSVNPTASDQAIHVVELVWSTVSDVYLFRVETDAIVGGSMNDNNGFYAGRYTALGPLDAQPIGLLEMNDQSYMGLTRSSNDATTVRDNAFAALDDAVPYRTDFDYEGGVGWSAGLWMIVRKLMRAWNESVATGGGNNNEMAMGYTRYVFEGAQDGTTLATGDVVTLDGTDYAVMNVNGTYMRLMALTGS